MSWGWKAGRPWKGRVWGRRVFSRLQRASFARLGCGPRPASGCLLQVCTSFTAEYAKYGHVKMHHGYTNVLGLGDSSTWRLPCLHRYVYMFLAPLLIPIITPLVAVGE